MIVVLRVQRLPVTNATAKLSVKELINFRHYFHKPLGILWPKILLQYRQRRHSLGL